MSLALTALRNQLSLRHNEIQTLIDTAQSTATTSSKGLTSGSYLNSLSAILPPTDSRLLLLEKWCSSSPGLEELFAVWDAATTSGWSKGPANSMNSTISALVMSVLTSILGLLSAHYPFHAHAHLVLKHLFENERWRRICGYATSSSNDLILGALKLLTVVVEKWDAKKVFDGFVWESKVCSCIPNPSIHVLTARRTSRNSCKCDEKAPSSNPTSELLTSCS